MAELKTKKNDRDVNSFLDGIENESKRRDAYAVLDIMKSVTGDAPAMWGENIIGFGSYTYTYASGRTGEWFIAGFSPRKQN